MLGCDVRGMCPNGMNTYGHSMIIDPWGTILKEASEDKDEIIYANLDFSFLNKKRSELPCLTHRRFDLFK